MADRVHISDIKEDVPIDEIGEVFETSVEIAKLISINIEGTEEAAYALDVSPDGETWFADEVEYELGQDIRDVFEMTDRHVRIRVTTAASADETADITIQGVR